MHLYERHNRIRNKELILAIALFIAIVLVFVLALSGVLSKNDAREERLMEDAIRRAAVTCYAVEGKYPESLSYLCEHYGVTVNTSRYLVRYEIFGANVMPSVSVLRMGGAS